MSARHRHPALRHRLTCDDDSSGTSTPDHECVCIHAPGHPADGSDQSAWHGCVCGAAWSDRPETALAPGEEEASGARVYHLFTHRAADTRADEAEAAEAADMELLSLIEESVVGLTVDSLDAAATRAERSGRM